MDHTGTAAGGHGEPGREPPPQVERLQPVHTAHDSGENVEDHSGSVAEQSSQQSTPPTGSNETTTSDVAIAREDETTPRSEAPSAADLHDGAADGYFSPVSSTELLPPALTRSSVTGSLIEPNAARGSDAAISHLDLNSVAVAHAARRANEEQQQEQQQHHSHDQRPVPQHTISSSSTASTATVRASDHPHQQQPHSTTSATSSSRSSRYPPTSQFPDQSYSALHRQRHPSPYSPQALRTRSSNPSPYHSYLAGAGAGARPPKVSTGSTPSGSRTAGNSPSSSPSLFTPGASPSRPKSVHDDTSGAYSSPFLHYTQRQVPKETHVADIDVDPVSGRKIINQYEIVDELGRGVHGKVKLGRVLPEGAFVAIKIVERYSKRKRLGKNTSHEDKIKKEIAILKKARHPNIVSLLEVIDDPQRKKVYIVLEFVELGEIAWRTKGLQEINLIEYRRYLRDRRNLDNEAEEVAKEEAAIIEEARKRRLKEERSLWKRRRDRLPQASDDDGWSFEHQGDEPDDGWDDSVSYVSSGTAGSYRSRRSTMIPEEAVDQALSLGADGVSPAPPPPEGLASEFATITGLSDAAAEMAKHASDTPQNASGLDTMTGTALDKTIYGADEDLPAPGRTPSVPDNAAVIGLEDPHHVHVPDNFQHVPLMTISQARNAFRDTVLGLEYLHFQGVIHRDVKPANLLQTKDHRVKISDFGVSYMGRKRVTADSEASESEVPDVDEALELAKTVGTPAFYAPELCQTDQDDEHTPPVTQQIDVWALGVTLYCLVFGRVPFHDHNPFALMAQIASDQVHIPKRRLKAVEGRSASRPGSRSRLFGGNNANSKRAAQDLEYEDIDENLHDLLKRLFVKDPRERITLTEVKHHPWLLQGISDPVLWLEETDPARSDGTRIQVSREDVQEAVVPLNIIDKITSNLRRGIGNVTGALGLGRSASARNRARSNAASSADGSQPSSSHQTQLPSAASSSSTISQDSQRAVARYDESIAAALRASKYELEHPLARSESATSEASEFGYHRYVTTGKGPLIYGLDAQSDADGESDSRPSSSVFAAAAARPQPSRAISTASATTTRTIRQRDVMRNNGLFQDLGGMSGNQTFPALPSTPKALEPANASSLGGLLGGAGRRLSRIVGRSRDRRDSSEGSGGGRSRTNSTSSRRRRSGEVDSKRKSVDRLFEGRDDPHAEASLGLSPALASATLRQPDIPSPRGSRPHSASASATNSPFSASRGNVVSRHSSVSSASSARRGNPTTPSRDRVNDVADQASPSPQRLMSPGDGAQEFDRAREADFRRRIFEDQQQQERQLSRPASARDNSGRSLPPAENVACPPSPDDEIFYQRQQQQQQEQQAASEEGGSNSRPRSATTSMDPPPAVPAGLTQLPPGKFVTPSSSEDHFASALSQSTSNPSIPSVVSADSSLSPDQHDGYIFPSSSFDDSTKDILRGGDGTSSGTDVPSDSSTIYSIPHPSATAAAAKQRHDELNNADDEGYAGDHAVESDGGDDSDSSGEVFLEITRRKPAAQRSGTASAPPAAEHVSRSHRPRRPTAGSTGSSGPASSSAGRVLASGAPGKAGRSGSNSTMQKVRRASGDAGVLIEGEEAVHAAPEPPA